MQTNNRLNISEEFSLNFLTSTTKSIRDLSPSTYKRNPLNIYSNNSNDKFSNVLAGLVSPLSPSRIAGTNVISLNEKLFEASSTAKILTSQVAMHLDNSFREKLFSQIDLLLDIQDWDPEDKPLQKASFYTFLRTIIFIKPNVFPSLGLSFSGNILAGWINGKNRLSIEFFSDDKVKWILTRSYEDNQTERSSSESSVQRLLNCLSPYEPEVWFNHD